MSDDFYRDMAERAIWTAVQGALGTASVEALASGDLSAWRAAAIGGLASVLSMAKSVAARRVGDPDSASTLKTWTAKTPPPEFVNDEEHTDG